MPYIKICAAGGNCSSREASLTSMAQLGPAAGLWPSPQAGLVEPLGSLLHCLMLHAKARAGVFGGGNRPIHSPVSPLKGKANDTQKQTNQNGN